MENGATHVKGSAQLSLNNQDHVQVDIERWDMASDVLNGWYHEPWERPHLAAKLAKIRRELHSRSHGQHG